LQEYLDNREWEERTKLDWYLAQIATVIERFQEGFKEHPDEISVKDNLLSFKVGEEPKKEEEEEEEEQPEVDFDKAFWLGRLGISLEVPE
jgi:hypothetical protein